MATDILGRRLAEFAGGFSTDDTLLTFPNLQGNAAYVPYLISQLGMQYGQQVSRIYSLNRSKVALASGRPQGNASLQQVLTPDGSMKQFYSTYGNVCNAAANQLQFELKSGCEASKAIGTQRFTCGLAVANQLALNVGAQDGLVNNNVTLSFESLAYTEG